MCDRCGSKHLPEGRTACSTGECLSCNDCICPNCYRCYYKHCLCESDESSESESESE